MALDLRDKDILITGGTGSFGNKCTEVLLRDGPPRRLIIYSRDELKQYEMRQRFSDPCMRFFIGDVRDRDRLNRAMDNVDIVIHAAALKHVPACEYNPFEAVKTNILGAVNIVDAAIDNQVDRVIALSTDKAVNPVNLYGATKLCAEKLFVQGNAYSGTRGTTFSCVRYGNVVASRGSVIPLFVQQRETGAITVTDRRMTRFWITLDQGVGFVLRCLDIMKGSEIFVPKIPSMNIMDLVEAIAPGCDTKITGIRPGEKIHEVLISEDEGRRTSEFDDMFIITPAQEGMPDESDDGLGNGHIDGGRLLTDEFKYVSDDNPSWLTVEQLRDMVAGL